MSHPIARVEDLIVKDLTSEVVVFDSQNNRVHALNPISSNIWRLCDGSRSIRDIAAELSMPFETVEAALEQFAERNLLKERLPSASKIKSSRRRQLAAMIGMAIALPAIFTVLAPRAHAVSSVKT